VRLTDVFETMSDGFVAFDANMNYTYVNAHGGEILGRKPADLLGKNYWREYPEAKGAPFANAYERALETRAAIIFEDYYAPFDRWFENRIYPSKDGLSVFFTEITERKQMEQALQASEERYRKVFLTSPDAINITRLSDGKYLDVNSGFETMVGYKRDEAIGKTSLELNIWRDPEDRRRLVDNLNRTGVCESFEAEFNAKNGRVIIGLMSGVIINIKDETCIISITRDITKRKKIEQELQQHREHLEELVDERTQELAVANAHLQALDRLKSLFIASMSHELRTPMNSILGFTELMLEGYSGEINEVQRDQLQRVYGSGKHLLLLITDIIDLSKVEAGKIEVSPETFDLEVLLDEVGQDNLIEARKKGIDIVVEAPQQRIHLYTDRQRLMQCLLNLISNAVKYSNTGSIRVSAQLHDETVDIAVRDSGIGLSTEEQARLFQPFERIDSELSVKAGGTGLGLYLTKKLVTELLGGTISVESRPGEGSCFTLHLPRRIQGGKV